MRACVRVSWVLLRKSERASKRVVLALVLLHAIRFCSCDVVDFCEGLEVTANFSFLSSRQGEGGGGNNLLLLVFWVWVCCGRRRVEGGREGGKERGLHWWVWIVVF